MTVDDLISELMLMPSDAQVHFVYNYGDHWATEVAPSIRKVAKVNVVFSRYHGMPRVVEDDNETDGEPVTPVVAIS